MFHQFRPCSGLGKHPETCQQYAAYNRNNVGVTFSQTDNSKESLLERSQNEIEGDKPTKMNRRFS